MAPTPRLVTISAWSHSRFNTYGQCPAKAGFLYIQKLKEPDSPAGQKGTRVHALAAVVASGELPAMNKDNAVFYGELKELHKSLQKSKKLPKELETFREEFLDLRKRTGIITEAEWCFTAAWEPTGWFDRDAWLRIKVDLHYLEVKKTKTLRRTRVVLRDYKTGKEHLEEHDNQRSLYGLGALLVYPDVTEAEVSHWYLDLGKESKVDIFPASTLDALKAEWMKKITAMMNDTTFAPRPGDYCRWCAFAKAKGGPCVF
jgi:PD-(D/E)XK nuclease superfamily